MLLGFTDFLDAREKAIVILLACFVVWVIWKADVRSSFAQVLRTLASWKLITLFGSAAAYSALVVLGLQEVGVWHSSSFKETLYWFFGTGVILVANSTEAASDPLYLRKLLRQAVKLTILVEFLVAFYVFPLLVELVLIPVVTIVVFLNLVAESDPKLTPARRALNAFITGLGFVVLAIVAIRAISDPDHLFTRANGEELLVAPVMTLALIPLLYAWALICGYEQLFVRVKFFRRKDRPFPGSVRWAILRACHVSFGRLTRFSNSFTGRLHGLQTDADRAEMIADFRANERQRRGRKRD